MAELTTMIELGGRDIEMRKPTDGALVVLARVARGLPDAKIENDGAEMSDEVREKMVRNLGTLGKIVEQMIVKDSDKDWLDDTMISGEVTAEDVFRAIREVGEKFNGQATTKKATSVRRVGSRPR